MSEGSSASSAGKKEVSDPTPSSSSSTSSTTSSSGGSSNGSWFNELLDGVGLSMPSLPDQVPDVSALVSGALVGATQVCESVDYAADAAAEGLKKARRDALDMQKEVLEPVLSDAWEIGREYSKKYSDAEDWVIGCVRKSVVDAYRSQPELVAGGTAAFLLLAFPRTRNFVVRNTVGRFRSQEGLYKAAVRRKTMLSEKVALTQQESTKLLQRTKMAQQEFQASVKKLRDARNQLDNLQSRLGRLRQESWSVDQSLKEIQKKEALQLRSEVAVNSSMIQKEKKTVSKAIKSIAALSGI